MMPADHTLTPELEVWLLADPDMSASWRGLARALDLASAVPVLEVTSRRRLASDQDKLAEVLRRWRAGPLPYTVDTLLRVLDIMVSGHQTRTYVSCKALRTRKEKNQNIDNYSDLS